MSNPVFRVLIDASVAEEAIRRLSGDPPGDQNQNNDMCSDPQTVWFVIQMSCESMKSMV